MTADGVDEPDLLPISTGHIPACDELAEQIHDLTEDLATIESELGDAEAHVQAYEDRDRILREMIALHEGGFCAGAGPDGDGGGNSRQCAGCDCCAQFPCQRGLCNGECPCRADRRRVDVVVAADPVDVPVLEYPVLVTARQTHVVWVRAVSQAAAVREVNDGMDPRTDGTLAFRAVAVYAPRAANRSDWNLVDQPGETYPGMACDAHVRTETLAQARQTCATGGHPDAFADPIDAGYLYCPTCAVEIPIPAADPAQETDA